MDWSEIAQDPPCPVRTRLPTCTCLLNMDYAESVFSIFYVKRVCVCVFNAYILMYIYIYLHLNKMHWYA